MVPVYNKEPYLRRAIDSVLAQTFPDFELVLIDDHIDRSLEVARSYADPRVRVIPPSNGGEGAARNPAAKHAPRCSLCSTAMTSGRRISSRR